MRKEIQEDGSSNAALGGNRNEESESPELVRQVTELSK